MALYKYIPIASSRHTSTDAYYCAQRPSREMDFKLMDYETYTFFPPLRPEQAIPPDLIRDCEARGFIAQIKKNGTNNAITVSPGHELTTTTRYGTSHKLWTPSGVSGQIFRSLPGNGWYVLNAELLHSKTAQIKDVNFIFDIYLHRSQKLIDHTFAQRQALLFALFVDQIAGEERDRFILNANTWLAKSFRSGLTTLFHSLVEKEDEGLVLRDPQAKWSARPYAF